MWDVFEGTISHDMSKHGGSPMHWYNSERTVSFASSIPLRTSFSLFRVHLTHNEAFVHFLERRKQWHLYTDREESGQSAVWLKVEMAKLFQRKAQ